MNAGSLTLAAGSSPPWPTAYEAGECLHWPQLWEDAGSLALMRGQSWCEPASDLVIPCTSVCPAGILWAVPVVSAL